ncbi:hypothetical protein EP073_11075 [Geovibrio thiophilus]|uniref:Uncharacterized protein n=1 Tax=Geovibrio thiophilus TaxID=139438 RepID=A0A410K0F4_9BACT|nr:hypothetical protein [Geovibrio thiophilus]QAR33926.1 hypothetical protein EP073_11075 [Geovibrio thiophilus]
MNKKRLIPAAAVVLLIILYIGASVFLKQKVVEEINEFASSAGFSEKIRYEALSVNPVTMSGTLKQVSLEDAGLDFKADQLNFNVLTRKSKIKDLIIANGEQIIKVDEIDIKKYKLEDGIPKTTVIDVTALRFPVDSPEIKSRIGADELVIDIQLATDADFKNKIYQYSKLNFMFRDLVDVKMNLTFSGVDIKSYAKFDTGSPDTLQNDPEFAQKVQEDLANLKLNSMTINLRDRGATDKLILSAEEGDNSTLEERRQKYAAELDRDIAETESPFERQLAEEMKKFILEGKKEAVITMMPKEPVSVQQIMLSSMMGAGMDELAEATGLKYEFK